MQHRMAGVQATRKQQDGTELNTSPSYRQILHNHPLFCRRMAAALPSSGLFRSAAHSCHVSPTVPSLRDTVPRTPATSSSSSLPAGT